MIRIENNTGISPVISKAEASETTLYTWCNGDRRGFEIVDEVPSGYVVWNIGRHNFPFIEFVPLAREIEGTNHHVDLSTLKAIRVKDEETALAILEEASRRGVSRNKLLKMSARIMKGRSATLNEPYLGYRNIVLVKYWDTVCKWEVEICGSGKHIWVYSDEFELD